MKYPYNLEYDPPFPAIPIEIISEETGLSIHVESALVDTGADGTLVPIGLLQDILTPALTDGKIRSHWGEWRRVQIFAVDIRIEVQ